MMHNQHIKINVSLDEGYKTLTALINGADFQWHSYENKATRSIKVMVINLQPSTSAKDIAKELKEICLKIKEVIQKLNRTTVNNINCSDAHPANYRVCTISKELE